jgi:hypothetical protein
MIEADRTVRVPEARRRLLRESRMVSPESASGAGGLTGMSGGDGRGSS